MSPVSFTALYPIYHARESRPSLRAASRHRGYLALSFSFTTLFRRLDAFRSWRVCQPIRSRYLPRVRSLRRLTIVLTIRYGDAVPSAAAAQNGRQNHRDARTRGYTITLHVAHSRVFRRVGLSTGPPEFGHVRQPSAKFADVRRLRPNEQ